MAGRPQRRARRGEIPDLLRLGRGHHSAGRLDEAEVIYRQILDRAPDHPQALHLLGVVAHQVGESARAADLIESAVAAAPDYAAAHGDLGLVYRALGRLDAAIESYRRAAAIDPARAEVHNNLGNALSAIGRYAEAAESYRTAVAREPCYAKALSSLGLALNKLGRADEAIDACRRAAVLQPDDPDVHCNLGLVQQTCGEVEAAVASYETCLRLNPQDAEAHNNLGNALQALERFEDAVTHYREAVSIAPDYVDAHGNLGTALQELERFAEAAAAFEAALGRDPANANAHNNLGLVYQDLGRFQDAADSYRRALAIDPACANAYSNLGLALNALGQPDGALAAFAAYLEATRGPDAEPDDRLREISKAKIDHDIEQFRYLAARGEDRFARLAETYAALRDEIAWPDGGAHLVALSPEQYRRIADSYNRPIHRIEAPRVAGSSLSDGIDAGAVTARYFDTAPGIAHFDGALCPQALSSLRRYLLESTIWFDARYRGGYLGAFLNDGLACPLLLQIAEDFRRTFPDIFGEHRLLQCWAYKYDSVLDGIAVHADAAAVNVNFWVTPDDANLDPDRGGLVVYRAEAPLDWRFKAYNADQSRIRAFLADHEGEAVVVPHRQNRVVLFNSDLFHETDRFSFRPGYENRRINVTMLFGRRQD